MVDDEADIRESLETLLCLEGYSVDLAQNGGEGHGGGYTPTLQASKARGSAPGPR